MRFITCIVIMIVLQAAALIQSPPRISKQPPTDELLFQVAQVNIDEEKPFLIECEAEGNPVPTYAWIKNGNEFKWQVYGDRISQQPGRGTLVISKPRHEDFGQYQCFAKNEWGVATSNSVFVRKAELKSFNDLPPKTERVNEGDPYKLTCQPPDGWPKPNVFWLIQDMNGGIKHINNSRITLDPEGNLWFSNVTKYDAFNNFYYACASSVSKNEYKIGNRVILEVTSTSSIASPNKREPVKQYVSRKNEVALRGKKVELFCIYGGTPLPFLVWSKNGQRIRPSVRVTEGNYGKSLIIKHVDFDDNGVYTCVVSNGVGSNQSYSINLEILSVPYFTVEPEIINAVEGETAELKCEASGVPEPDIKWIHNGQLISERFDNENRYAKANKIILKNLKKSDIGNYGCNATNSVGYVYKDVYVNVLALPPEILRPPTDKLTVYGKTIIMTCRVSGAPKPAIKWIRNGQELSGGRYKTLGTGDLLIRDVSFSDAGEYNCYAANKFGIVNATGRLVIKDCTRIIDASEDYKVAVGGTVTLRCLARADPTLPLQIIWLYKGKSINFESNSHFILNPNNSLLITKISGLDSGTYTCVASTDLDKTEAQITLTVEDVPKPPTVLGVTCGSKEAQVSWISMSDDNPPVLRFSIQYKTSFTPDTWGIAKDVPATDQSVRIGLSPSANYTFRLIAWNTIGPSQPSSYNSVCTTLPDVPYKNPDNVEGKGDDAQNLIVKWTVMPQIEHNAPNFMYRVHYKRDTPGEKWTTEDIHDWRTNKLKINNQPTYQRYKIKVGAINQIGECKEPPQEIDVLIQASTNEYVGESFEKPITQGRKNTFNNVWFIGMMLGIALFFSIHIVCFIVWIIKRNRGGSYAVVDAELAAGRPDYSAEGCHEYSHSLNSKSRGGRTSSMSSSGHDDKHLEPQTDSLVELGEELVTNRSGIFVKNLHIGEIVETLDPRPCSRLSQDLVTQGRGPRQRQQQINQRPLNLSEGDLRLAGQQKNTWPHGIKNLKYKIAAYNANAALGIRITSRFSSEAKLLDEIVIGSQEALDEIPSRMLSKSTISHRRTVGNMYEIESISNVSASLEELEQVSARRVSSISIASGIYEEIPDDFVPTRTWKVPSNLYENSKVLILNFPMKLQPPPLPPRQKYGSSSTHNGSVSNDGLDSEGNTGSASLSTQEDAMSGPNSIPMDLSDYVPLSPRLQSLELQKLQKQIRQEDIYMVMRPKTRVIWSSQ